MPPIRTPGPSNRVGQRLAQPNQVGQSIPKPRPSKIDILDCQSLYGVIEYLKEAQGTASALNYSHLMEFLREERSRLAFRPVETTFAAAAVDLLSDAQSRFVDALARLGIAVEKVDFRHAQYGPPIGASSERATPPGSSLAPQISYLLGLLTSREEPQVIVVSGNFALFGPLLDFVRTRGGKAALAFFRRFLEPRWLSVGVLDKDLPFIDLDPISQRLLGVDLTAPTFRENTTQGGLAAL